MWRQRLFHNPWPQTALDMEEIIRNGQFRKEQEQEPIVQYNLKEGLAKQEGEVVNLGLAEAFPRSEVRNSILYQVECGKGEDEVLQFLVPQKYWQTLLLPAHTLPMEGHLGHNESEALLRQ